MSILLLATAMAAPRIVSVGAAMPADGSGNWPRIFPDEKTGWTLLTANQSGVIHTGLDDAFARVSDGRLLVADDSMIDHGYANCPDGTILHVSMGTRTSVQHTAVVRRFDADWNVLSTTTLIDDDPKATIIDQGVVCGEHFQGFGYLYSESELDAHARIFLFDEDDTPLGEYQFDDMFDPIGMSMFERDGQLIAISGDIPFSQDLRVVTIDTDLNTVDERFVPVDVETTRVYWPQAVMDIGGYTFLAYIRQDDRDWVGQMGEVYLAQFDADWNVVDNVAVYAPGPGDGGFQPGFARRGDDMVITFTQASGNTLVPVTLDTSDVDTGSEDTDPPDTGGETGGGDTDTAVVDSGGDTDTDTDTAAPDTDTETDTATDDPEAPGCGCGHGGFVASGWVVALLAAGASRRRG